MNYKYYPIYFSISLWDLIYTPELKLAVERYNGKINIRPFYFVHTMIIDFENGNNATKFIEEFLDPYIIMNKLCGGL